MVKIEVVSNKLGCEVNLIVGLVRNKLEYFNGKNIDKNTLLNKKQFNTIIDMGHTDKAKKVKAEINEEYFSDIKLEVRGTQQFSSKLIPVLEGGFCENQRVISDKHIAEIHNTAATEIRKTINRNRNRFKYYVDIIDVKRSNHITTLLDLGYAKQSITQAENIYVLSERGYAKLIKIMDSDLAWDVHDKLIDEYFTMRALINSDEQLKKELAYKLLSGGVDSIEAHKKLLEIEKKPLLQKIEADAPKIESYNHFINAEGLLSFDDAAKIIGVGRNHMLDILRSFGILITDTYEDKNNKKRNGVNHNMPYQNFMKYFEVKTLGTNKYTGRVDKKVFVKPNGLEYIKKKMKEVA